MPRSARDIVRDLRALLRAAGVPGPYVLVGHSFGGMIARLYATTYPRRIAGLVSIDAQNEDFAAAYKEFFSPEQYEAAVLNPGPPPGLRTTPHRAARPRAERRADAPGAGGHAASPDAARRPSHSQTLPNPFGFPPDWPIEALEQAFQDSQDMLAALVPDARHVIATKAGTTSSSTNRRLVTREIRRVVREVRRRPLRPAGGLSRPDALGL